MEFFEASYVIGSRRRRMEPLKAEILPVVNNGLTGHWGS
jgi:hypothetical protein